MTLDRIENCRVKMHNRTTRCDGNKFTSNT